MEVKSRIQTIFTNYKSATPIMTDTLKNRAETGDCYVPENLSWIINLHSEQFAFNGSTPHFGVFGHLRNIGFHDFVRLVKPCFIESHLLLIEYIITYCTGEQVGIVKNKSFQILLPMRLSHTQYYYVKQTIVPKFSGTQLYALQLINIPIKYYDKECYSVEVCDRGDLDVHLSAYMLEKLGSPKLFTGEQLSTVKLIKEGLTSSEIAMRRFKTKAAVYKLNRKIIEKISEYFDMEFSNVHEAVHFYFDCFKQGTAYRQKAS